MTLLPHAGSLAPGIQARGSFRFLIINPEAGRAPARRFSITLATPGRAMLDNEGFTSLGEIDRVRVAGESDPAKARCFARTPLLFI